LRDLYHRFLGLRWPVALGLIVLGVLFLNALFAVGYYFVGGVANMRPGSFRDAFYFSVHTFATIGYGSMYPTGDGAEALVVAEALVGLLTTALATGLLVAKFTISSARVIFSRYITIAPMDGVPTLMFRLSNERGNQIVEAQIRVAIMRTERTREGVVFYRMLDLPLSRERSPAFSRSFTALHPITETSPIFGATPESFRDWELELMVSMIGTDDTSLQPVHARRTYSSQEVLWGMRPADILSENADGSLVLDLAKFHEVVATEATAEFPYSAGSHQRTSAPE
jgi:inward rectifier potassium channel